MREQTVKALCWAERDFVEIDGRISDLRKILIDASSEVPSCAAGAKRLTRALFMVRKALWEVDRDLYLAVRAAEQTNEEV